MVITLEGNWRSGKAYDLHTVASTYLGPNEFGHEQFETTRSAMGELVYQLKYKSDKSTLSKIVGLLDEIKGIENFDYLVPVPPTKRNRPIQPVLLIAEALGTKRNVRVLPTLLINSGDEELKGVTDPVARIELLRKALKLDPNQNVSGKKLLLVDDLYRSGSTLSIATELLYEQGKASQVCVLTMTKTRSNR